MQVLCSSSIVPCKRGEEWGTRTRSTRLRTKYVRSHGWLHDRTKQGNKRKSCLVLTQHTRTNASKNRSHFVVLTSTQGMDFAFKIYDWEPLNMPILSLTIISLYCSQEQWPRGWRVNNEKVSWRILDALLVPFHLILFEESTEARFAATPDQIDNFFCRMLVHCSILLPSKMGSLPIFHLFSISCWMHHPF